MRRLLELLRGPQPAALDDVLPLAQQPPHAAGAGGQQWQSQPRQHQPTLTRSPGSAFRPTSGAPRLHPSQEPAELQLQRLLPGLPLDVRLAFRAGLVAGLPPAAITAAIQRYHAITGAADGWQPAAATLPSRGRAESVSSDGAGTRPSIGAGGLSSSDETGRSSSDESEKGTSRSEEE
jgi:hypothetical protein